MHPILFHGSNILKPDCIAKLAHKKPQEAQPTDVHKQEFNCRHTELFTAATNKVITKVLPKKMGNPGVDNSFQTGNIRKCVSSAMVNH